MALLPLLAWAGFAVAETPHILVATPHARRAARGLAGEFAEVAVLRTADDAHEDHDLLPAKVWELRGVRLLVVSSESQELAIGMWCERLAAQGIPVVRLTNRRSFPAGSNDAYQLRQLHCALAKVFPEYLPQLDRALQRELQRLDRATHAEQWAREPAILPRVGESRLFLATYSAPFANP